MSAGSPGDQRPREPALDHLIRALTAEPAAEELAGRDAALAMFKASRRRHRRMRFVPLTGVAAIACGIIVVAYVAILPAPAQRLAYHLLAGIGVPNAHHASLPSAPRHAATSCSCHRRQPASAAAWTLFLAAARAQIPAGADDVFSQSVSASVFVLRHARPS